MSKPRRPWRARDPHLTREMERYGRAIPSRELVLELLSNKGAPLAEEALCAELGLAEPWELEAFGRRLRAMEREGQLIRNRRGAYGVVQKMDLIPGRVFGHPDGYGFLEPDDGSDGLYISPRRMRELLHGDRVVMRVAGMDRRGRREGALVEILERNTVRVAGRFYKESGIGFVVPDNKRISQDIVIPPEYQQQARPSQIVVAEVVEQPTRHNRPIGRIREVLGDHMAPGMEVEIAIVSHDIPAQWPEAVLPEAAAFGTEVAVEAKADRVDLRGLPLVTIDGIDARDFDDAVYCERRGKNWRLVVAIADVSHYVAPNTALDAEALNRGNSVYFPDRVVPMLPEALSNELCSLKPQVDRLCLACEMTITPAGTIARSRFFEAVMRSAARFTYSTVAGILVERHGALRREYEPLVPHLEALYGVYKALRAAREARGAIDFDLPAPLIEYGPERKIERILPLERNDAHRVIEECMIAANIAAARFLTRQRMPGLYRVHDGPKQSKLEALRAFLGELGLGLGGGERPGVKDYERLVVAAEGRPDYGLIQTVLLRSLPQAVYSAENRGHFGLGLEAYAHFTSPIRRYPDLLVHRAIRHALRGAKPREFGYSAEDMAPLGEHCSMTERRADEATRDAVDWLKCEFMQERAGNEYDGIVTGVTGFGLFVQLNEVFVDGLVHVTALDNDYYHFNPVGHRLEGERTGKTYRLGDRLRVRVARVDLDERKIDFDLVASEERGRRARSRFGRRRTRRA